MSLRLIPLAVLLVLPCSDTLSQGRKGNELYREEKYAEAAETYRQAISALDDAPSRTRFGLLNNLGSALFRMGQFGDARETFSQAASAAGSDTELSRAYYNTGNAAYSTQSLEESLRHYQRALLTDPTNEDARFNYEFVKRKMNEQKEQQQQQGGGQQNDQQQNQDPGSSPEQQNQQQDESQQQDQQPGDDPQQSEPEQPREGQEEQQPGQAPQPDPNELSREQAERILQALQSDEEKLLREVQKQKTHPRDVEKDW